MGCGFIKMSLLTALSGDLTHLKTIYRTEDSNISHNSKELLRRNGFVAIISTPM